MIRRNERGQAHTLEAFTAAMILLASIVFALQVTAVTPLTASTSSQHIENQQAGVAKGLLASAVANDSLKPAVLYWNDSRGAFHGTPVREYYTNGGPSNTTFGHMLNRTFRDRGIAVDVNIYYLTSSDARRQQEMVNFGAPSDNAVGARQMVTLYDNDTLYEPGEVKGNTTVSEASGFYADDIAPDSRIYNVLVVEVVVWRM